MNTGDIVQITSEAHHWYGCLIVVTEIKSWGVQGYAPVPQERGQPVGQAYIRLVTGDFKKVGSAVIVAE